MGPDKVKVIEGVPDLIHEIFAGSQAADKKACLCICYHCFQHVDIATNRLAFTTSKPLCSVLSTVTMTECYGLLSVSVPPVCILTSPGPHERAHVPQPG